MENTEIEKAQEHVMSVGEWMVTLLVSFIPIVNIVMYFVWGLGGNTNPNKANWAKASLIWIAIVIALYILIFVVIFSGAALMDGIEV